MENLKGKTAQEVFDAACRVYSDKHNDGFSSFCDTGEIQDFIERLRSELNIKPPDTAFADQQSLAAVEKEIAVTAFSTSGVWID